jgi:hypothetical protein
VRTDKAAELQADVLLRSADILVRTDKAAELEADVLVRSAEILVRSDKASRIFSSLSSRGGSWVVGECQLTKVGRCGVCGLSPLTGAPPIPAADWQGRSNSLCDVIVLDRQERKGEREATV